MTNFDVKYNNILKGFRWINFVDMLYEAVIDVFEPILTSRKNNSWHPTSQAQGGPIHLTWKGENLAMILVGKLKTYSQHFISYQITQCK